MFERQYTPTIEDVKNTKVKKLLKRLKRDSDKETLTNILEWQDRNLRFWTERCILDIPATLIIPVYFSIFIWISLPVLIFFHLLFSNFVGGTLSFIFLSTMTVIFLFFLFWQSTIVKLTYILIFSLPLYQMMKIYITNFLSSSPALAITILNLTVLNWVIFGVTIVIIFYLLSSYHPFFREHPLRIKIKKLTQILNDTFQLSLPVKKVLEYRLAICRDYAKLTASFLLNVYPKNKLYFILIPRHTAAAIELKGKRYVLDQKLPIFKEKESQSKNTKNLL